MGDIMHESKDWKWGGRLFEVLAVDDSVSYLESLAC
jgi:hypothetical protein